MLFRYLGSSRLLVSLVLSTVTSLTLVLAAAGDLDTSFGTGGKSSADITGQLLDDAVGDIALLKDGRILVAGTTSSGFPSEHDVSVVVFHVDGSVDQSFGQNGRVMIDQGGKEYCFAVAVQPDGRILLGGYRTVLAGGPPESLVLRLNSDGTIDTSFGTQGVFQPALPFGFVDLAVLPDGAIVAAGSRPTPGGSDFAVARLTPTGILDTDFGEAGVVILDFGADDYLTQLSANPDGRLFLVGLNTTGGLELTCLLANGSEDITFGRRIMNLGCFYSASAALQLDGKMLVGTTVGETGLSDFLLARLNPDGTLDPSFGADGIVTGDLTGTDDYLTCLTLQADGKILAVGWAGFYPDFLVQRYNADGSIDQDFGPGGWVHTDFVGDKDRARVAVVQPDGRFVLAGDVPGSDIDESRDFGLARYQLTPPPSDPRADRPRGRVRPRAASIR